jgi:hypothetical protein
MLTRLFSTGGSVKGEALIREEKASVCSNIENKEYLSEVLASVVAE